MPNPKRDQGLSMRHSCCASANTHTPEFCMAQLHVLEGDGVSLCFLHHSLCIEPSEFLQSCSQFFQTTKHCRFDAEFKPVLFAQILSPPFQTSLIFPLEEQVYKPDHIFKPITHRMLTVLTHNKVLSFHSPKYSRTYLLQRSFPQPLPSPSTELFY